jgi:multiple sugar transport system substrate-binding protein
MTRPDVVQDLPSRRGVLLGAAGLAAGAMVSGCGRLSGEQTAPSSGEQVLRFAQFYTTQSGAAAEVNKRWLQSIKSAFEQENAGWTLQLEGYSWDQIDQRLLLDLRGGVPHDVSLTSPQLMAQHAGAGSLMDLTPQLQKWDAKESADFDWSPVWKSGVVDGKQYGIPLGLATRALAYRKDLYGQTGVTGPDKLSTPDELVRAAKKLTTSGRSGLGIYLGPSRATTENSFAPAVWNFGGDFFDEGKKEATLTSSAAVEAATWLRSLVKTDKVVPAAAYAPTGVYDDLLKYFVDGRTASAWGLGNFWISALNEAKMIQGCFPAAKECATTTAEIRPLPTTTQAAFTNAWMISIASQSKQTEMAWKLIELLLRPENLRAYPDAGLPARRSEYDRPEYASSFYQTWRQVAEKGRGMPATPYYAQLADGIAAALQDVITKGQDPRTVLAKYGDDWNAKYAGK